MTIGSSDETRQVKARAYCARQERSTKEVQAKLHQWGASEKEAEQLLKQLVKEGFLDEARFAAHYAVSKSRQKGWGRRKIEQGLRQKGVPGALIAAGLRAIEAGEEDDQLRLAVAKRWERTKDGDPYLRKAKLVRYFAGKGFDADRVEAIVDGLA